MSNDISHVALKPLYASVVEDEGALFIGFAEGEDETEPYVLFRQDFKGAPVWFEVCDDSLGGEDVIESVTETAKGLSILIKPVMAQKIGWAREITVKITPMVEDAAEALAALAELLGPIYRKEA